MYELGVVVHERSAWIRHMLTPKQPDMGTCLSDVLPTGLRDFPGQAPANANP
ncbi:hypothetical protein GCM10009838_72210 [Catenulispora subtropica]|uniref:Uncharacterized protein n=1 Tax=Catenulispora subtropica TaxID=450798 RepID=A0ABN2T1S0_9ACTN